MLGTQQVSLSFQSPFTPPSTSPLGQLLNCRSISSSRSSFRFNFRLKASLQQFPLASRIFVRNLSYSTSESCLLKEFARFGQIAEIELVKDEAGKKHKGYAFIQYTCQDDAVQALESMDQEYLHGRLIHVELAKPGGKSHGGYPKTCGPPKEQHLHQHSETEEVDSETEGMHPPL